MLSEAVAEMDRRGDQSAAAYLRLAWAFGKLQAAMAAWEEHADGLAWPVDDAMRSVEVLAAAVWLDKTVSQEVASLGRVIRYWLLRH